VEIQLRFSISLVKEKFVLTHRYTVSQETEKLDRCLINQYLSTSGFYKNIKRSNIFVDTRFLTEGVFVTQLSRNEEIPFRRIVWVTTSFCFMSGLPHRLLHKDFTSTFIV
jgi:hypothetical protein